jgi:plastocyanin
MFVFSPATVSISVGDTVRWTWASSFHSVSSGTPCATDSQFCSPDDMNCALRTLSNAGAVYQHTFTQAGTYSYFCAAHCEYGMTGTINVAPAACTAPPLGMAGWWAGEGNARDIASGDNGTLQDVAFVAGKVGQTFSLNGNTSFVEIPNRAAVRITGAISIDAWINPATTAPLTQEVFSKYDSPSNQVSYSLSLRSGGALRLAVYQTGDASILRYVDTVTGIVPTGTFTHVAGTFDPATQATKIYVNGADTNASLGGGSTIVSSIFDSTTAVRIGAVVNSSVGITPFSGLIDEAELFNRALSPSEIAAIANAGAAGKCKPPQPATAFSRKTHGGAGTFDIDLMPNTTPGIECRSGGASNVYQMIVQFSDPVTVAGATLITGTGSVSGFSVNGGVVTIDLSNIANAQTIVVKLTGVNDGTLSGDVPVAMGVLIGDTNGNRAVSASDIGQTKAQSGGAATAANFRTDVNASGSISAADIGLVKSKSGTTLPP